MPTTFTDLGVPARLAEALADNGMTEAFEVQEATIPDALAGRDLCGRAPTGSGKTIAFGVPVMARVSKAKPSRPTALILSPTRELADQIRDELLPMSIAADRKVTAVYGGVGYGAQINALRRGVDVLVACPGRLIDHIDSGNVSLADVEIVVVDEADRMADMGFLPVVRKLLDQTKKDRQTLLFSATLDGDIAELTRRYQHDPARHEIGDAEPDITAMTHHFWSIRHEDRVDHARDAIMAAGPTIVFTRTRHGADRLATQLGKAGVTAAAIHGGRNQNQRTRALESFTRGQAHALIATDVAARGIHVDGVECVVHFDPPEDDKTYLHRSGRTARAGAKGVVVSFVRPDNKKDVNKLQRDLGLNAKFTDPDAAQLGDGSNHRPMSKSATATKSKPEKPRSKGDGRPPRDSRPSDRTNGPGNGSGPRPRKRNANLYAADDPRIEKWEANYGDRVRDGEERGQRDSGRRSGGGSGRPSSDRPRTERGRDERPRTERSRDDRSRDDRPREDRTARPQVPGGKKRHRKGQGAPKASGTGSNGAGGKGRGGRPGGRSR